MSVGHSAFVVHSGRQPIYGSPKKSSMHAHDPAPFCSLHIVFDPHGDGLQGFVLSLTGGAKHFDKKIISAFFEEKF